MQFLPPISHRPRVRSRARSSQGLAIPVAVLLACSTLVLPMPAAHATASLTEPSIDPEPSLLDERDVNHELDRRLDTLREQHERQRRARGPRPARRRATMHDADATLRREPVELSVQPLPPPSE